MLKMVHVPYRAAPQIVRISLIIRSSWLFCRSICAAAHQAQ